VLTLELPGAVLREHNLLPLAEPQVRVTALLFFTDATGNRQLAEIDELTSPVLPR
jgi:methane/ammonia monooxygenase subunit B